MSAIHAGPPLPNVLAQHVQEAAQLRRLRSTLVRHRRLDVAGLARFDERIAAHLDGISIAGTTGRQAAWRALERAGPGELFVVTVGAIEDRDVAALDRVFALADSLPASRAGLWSALGWVSAAALRGLVSEWLAPGASASRRAAALAACAMHAVDPGRALDEAMVDLDPALRAVALRVAGRSGRSDLLDACLSALDDADAGCRFESAHAALRFGHRDAALAHLGTIADAPVEIPGSHAAPTARYAGLARSLLLMTLPVEQGARRLAAVAREPARAREAIGGIASVGDPRLVPWLIERMAEPDLARAAGDAFAWITGLDLSRARLDHRPPDAGSGRDPDLTDEAFVPPDPDINPDEDDLPVPHLERIDTWWREHRARFVPGCRYFAGEAPDEAVCRRVLASGFQRQRVAAAEHLALARPATPLFDVAAPAWRQRRLLGMAAAR